MQVLLRGHDEQGVTGDPHVVRDRCGKGCFAAGLQRLDIEQLQPLSVGEGHHSAADGELVRRGLLQFEAAGFRHALSGLRNLVGARHDEPIHVVGHARFGQDGARAGLEPLRDCHVVIGDNEREPHGYRPVNRGRRLSRNARVPSRMSSVLATRPKSVASNRKPSANDICSPWLTASMM